MFDFLNLPKASEVNSKIDKKMLYENSKLSSKSKQIIKEDVGKIIWCNRIAFDTVNIMGYCDNIKDYSEIQVIAVIRNNKSDKLDLSEVLAKSIPYPLIVIFTYESAIKISAISVHINQNDSSKMIIDEITATKWHDVLDKDYEFFDFTRIKGNNLFEIHSNFIKQITLFNASEIIGKTNLIKYSDVKLILDKVSHIDSEINELVKQIKKEDQINIQIELSDLIQKKKMEKQKLIEKTKTMR